MFNTLVGALRVEATLDGGKFVDGARKIKAEAAGLEGSLKKSVGGMGGALKAGLAGFAGALSVGLFTQVIGKSLEYAASLKTVSQQLGVTTRDLQILRYAAAQNGVKNTELDQGLKNLTITLGQVAVGAERPRKALEAIGITADQLKGKDTGQAFRMIADGLAKITDRSQRAAVEMAIFKESGTNLDTILSGGSKAIDELAGAAERLGIVLSDEQIQRADETANKLNDLKTVLSANIAGAVADNSDAILVLANALGALINSIGQAIKGWGRLQASLSQPLNLKEMPWTTVARADRAWKFRQAMLAGNTRGGGAEAIPPGMDVGDFMARAPRAGRRARAPREDHSAQDRLRDEYQFAQEQSRAEQDILRAKQSLARDYIERTTLSIEMQDKERDAYYAELAYNVALNDLTKGKEGMTRAQADAMKALYDQKDALQRQAILAEEQEQRERDVQALTQGDFDRRRAILESQGNIARTAEERRRIELELLRLAYQQRAQALQNIIDTKGDSAEAEQARRDLLNLKRTYANDQQGVMNRTAGPLEQWAQSIPRTAAEVNEALQSIEAQGLDGLSDAITDVITGTRSLKDAFGDLARSIIADIVRMTVKMLIFRALSSVFGGIFGGGQAPAGAASYDSLMDSGIYGDVPRFATGGSFRVLGNSGVDRNILSLNGLPIAQVSHGERVDIANDNVNGGGGPRTVINMNGVITNDQFWQEVDRRSYVAVVNTGPAIARAGAAAAVKTLTRPSIHGR